MARLYSRMPTNGSFLIAALPDVARLAVAVMPALRRGIDAWLRGSIQISAAV